MKKSDWRRSLLSLIPLCLRCCTTAAKGAPPEITLLLPNGGHFVGDFNAQFIRHGEGVHFSADGSEVASGQWRDGKQHGPDKWANPDGRRYEGEFVDSMFSGLGKYTWADGRMFEGEFKNDVSSGFGISWTADGNVAECGSWANDELVESCPVPRSKIPIGSFLSAAGEPRAGRRGRTALQRQR